VFDRVVRREEPTPVAERVGRHVHDAHEDGALPEGEHVLTAAPHGALSHAVHRSGARSYRMPMWFMASCRVRASVRKSRRTAEVTVIDPGFLIPRMDMQRCSASIQP